MNTEVVHDDDLPWAQHGNEALFEIDAEDGSVHRLIDDERCDNALRGQTRNEGRDFPVTVGQLADEPFAAPTPASEPAHACRRCGLVDEDETLRIELVLICAP